MGGIFVVVLSQDKLYGCIPARTIRVAPTEFGPAIVDVMPFKEAVFPPLLGRLPVTRFVVEVIPPRFKFMRITV
ncbi:hypothetical protein [Cronobacter phage EspYZU12]|nr:hypothetical protein EspYZU15_170 [Cronobacter phage EspYZU15]WAK45576.1 hypothetical protein EspYZU14_172 [Cronobacter phage EspYZU14]WBF78360.1 hypothetical protein [Cronobacter phage EspYZU12]